LAQFLTATDRRGVARRTKEVNWRIANQGVVIEDRCSRDAIYVATTSQQVRGDIEERRKAALTREEAFPADLTALEKLKK
jgi:hypothetical protein